MVTSVRDAAGAEFSCLAEREELDGQTISSGKSKVQLGLGPHLLAAIAGDRRQEYRFVVLDEGPDKFKLEIK